MEKEITVNEDCIMKPLGVSFHVFPHMMSNGPLPALGYIKAYAESRMNSLNIRPVYWSTFCIRLFKELRILGNSSSIEGNAQAQSLFEDLFVAMALSKGEFQNQQKLQEVLQSCNLLIEPHKDRNSIQISPTDFLDKLLKWLESKAQEVGCMDDDIIACSFSSIQSLQALSFLSVFRKWNPGAWFVVGGLTKNQATLLMESAPFVDIAVFGEGEESFLELCRARQDCLPLESIKGIVFRRETSVIVNDARDIIGDIHGHWADYRGFDWKFAAGGGAEVDLPIWDSRNCWWGRCEFCDFMKTQQAFAEREADDIKAEIDLHVTRNPEITQIRTRVMLLGLEACGSDRNRFVRVLDDLVDLKRNTSPKMSAFFELSPRNSNRQIMKRLNELSSCVQCGFEQVNGTLEICNKSHRIEHVIDTLKLVARFPNIRIAGFNLMISVPDDTFENCLVMRDNLWLLRFVLSMLYRQRQMQKFRPIQIDVCEGIAFGRLVDFTSVGVRGDLRRVPWVDRYSSIIGDDDKAIDFGATLQLTSLPDSSLTLDKYLSVIEEVSDRMGKYSMKVYENRDNELVIFMEEEGSTVEVTLSDYEQRLLSETAFSRKFQDLEMIMEEEGSPKTADVLGGLARNGLVWFDVKRKICINTLPPEVQDALDLFHFTR